MSEFEEVREGGRPPEKPPDRLSEEACEDHCGGRGAAVPGSKTTDTVFGPGRVDERTGAIDFGTPPVRETVAAPGDRVGAPGDKPPARLDEAQLRLELMQTAMKMMIDIFSKAMFGFGKDQGGGGNPFMEMIQKLMQRALGEVTPAPKPATPGPGPRGGPRRP